MPWVELDDFKKLDLNTPSCSENIFLTSSYPVSYSSIVFQIDGFIKNSKETESCISSLLSLKEKLENLYKKGSSEIGYQSGYDSFYIQDSGRRVYKNDIFFISQSNVINNFAYKFKIAKDLETQDTFFDESYVSMKLSNNIFTFGRKSRWWSPSERVSLILSNSARPTYGIELKNYTPIKPKIDFIKFIGALDYEFFINRLESERHISNALLFGNRINIYPNNRFQLSFIRLAQFGGDNRPQDAKTILNMLIGRDNTSQNLSFKDQPGNQLAGIDFKFKPRKLKNIEIYGQSIGEDEAGMFPSRKFHLLGTKIYLNNQTVPSSISFDYYDTFSGIKNYTYNHGLYKDGLRHYKKPIGAAVDADSKELALTYKTKISDNINFKLVLSDTTINKNNSNKNYWTDKKIKIKGADINFTYTYKRFNFNLIFLMHNNQSILNDKSNYIFSLSYRL